MSKYNGIPSSDGIAIGKAVLVGISNIVFEKISRLKPSEEKLRFRDVLENFKTKTEEASKEMRKNIGESEADILLGHILIATDRSVSESVHGFIDDGMTAEAAVDKTFDMFCEVLSSTNDELTQERITDLKDIKSGLIRLLKNPDDKIFGGNLSDLPSRSILVACDLTPSQTAGIDKTKVCGIVTETGSRTSHSSILARALGIPAVSGVDGILKKLRNGDELIVDGAEGVVISEPNPSEIKEYCARNDAYESDKKELLKYLNKPTLTADGRRIELLCNIGTADECVDILKNSGEGAGLLRTEFLYMGKSSAPGEEEQYNEYKKAAIALKGKPLIIRTLDVGGDKEIGYMNIPKEENPFMGYRGIRFCLKNPQIFMCQIRALLRAAVFGDIRMMLPMITGMEELHAVKTYVEQAKKDLEKEEIEYSKSLKLGIMIETPAATIMADKLAAEVDFFSIGTNDLTGYTLAVDRGNANVSYLYSPYNPAVIRSIKHIAECSKKAKIPVGMCGEAAADPLMIPILLSFGLDELSVGINSVLKIRKAVSQMTKSIADKITEEVLLCATEAEVKTVLEKYAVNNR